MDCDIRIARRVRPRRRHDHAVGETHKNLRWFRWNTSTSCKMASPTYVAHSRRSVRSLAVSTRSQICGHMLQCRGSWLSRLTIPLIQKFCKNESPRERAVYWKNIFSPFAAIFGYVVELVELTNFASTLSPIRRLQIEIRTSRCSLGISGFF